MAKPSAIKPSQLTRVGYAYQDLMCIRMLINWFHAPEKYQWMSIEGNQELGSVKSLDDVICLTADGKYELYQVKFTTDSSRDDLMLDFEYLLEKKPNGTSLLQKWTYDLIKFGTSDVISIAKLITNRKPDTVLSSCLDGNKIGYNLVPDDIKARILIQLGDEQNAIIFFNNIIFEHSQPEIDDLELQLQDSLVPDHANNESWLQLLKTVKRWATRKNEPFPDGKIYLEHIYEILSLESIKTISQFFEVPGGYIPPVEEFHKEILERTTKPGCTVISGLPGMGKSTYLSFLTDQLIEKKTPVIRHHYYLSPHFIGDRINYNNAAQSLQSQIKSLYPDYFHDDKLDPQQLHTWIYKATDIAAESGEILVIIIDGLDHVYRERSDISQLEHLVNRLDPLKEKICLLYGTQPISDEYLPNSLLRSAPRERSWLNIPGMGLDAIKKRIDFLVSIEEIDILGEDEHQRREIVEISQALLNISQGYPLHIVYSLNSLKLAGNKISKYDVERLPICPEGDIHSYYDNLWVSLSESAKEILLLIANADFSWPDETHLGYCFEDSLSFRNSFAEIQHLLEKRLSGITPFHNSLFVYLKRKDAFSGSKERLNQKSKAWIDQHAPEYWKWGWSWIIDANLGNIGSLLQGITREWLIQSLCKAYPLEHIEHIIGVAENIAFEQSLYPELLRLRILKTRLLNGSEFQIQNFSDFLDCSLSCTSDTFGLLWRADNLKIIPDNEIVIVAKHLQGKNERIVNACVREIYRRIQFYARLEDSNHYQTLNSLVDGYLQVLISCDSPDLERINAFYERLTDKSSSFTRIIELIIQYGHRHLLLDLSPFDIPEDISSKVIDEIVLAASVEGVLLEEVYRNIDISNSSLGLLHLLLAGKNVNLEKLTELECPEEYEAATYHLFYQCFFNTLVSRLNDSNVIEEPHLSKPTSIEKFIKNAWLTFEYASFTIATRVKTGEKFEASALYNTFAILELPDQYLPDGYKLNAVLFNIRKSLAKIAIHLNILYNSIDDFTTLNEYDFLALTESLWWDSSVFFDVAAQNSIFGFSKNITSQEFHKLFEAELHRRENTATLANDSLELGILAIKHGLHDEASQFLERAALNIVGYGWRKDITFHEVFEAIEECSNSNCPQVSDWLTRVATFTSDVFVFSEREIRHIPGWFIKLLSKHKPERLVDEFDYHLAKENWHLTDIILENIVKTFPLSTQAEYSFLRCMTTFNALAALKERAEGNETLERIYAEQCKTLGGMPPPPREHSSTKDEETPESPDVTTIQPNNLEEFKSTLHAISYKIRKQFIADWIAYWVDQDQGTTILNSFNTYYEQEKSDYELDQCLHEMFLLSKKIEGKTKAYIWAIRDIKLNNCWSRYSHSYAVASLKQYGSTYKNIWGKILRDTMSPGSSRLQRDENILVPSTQLVVFLASADQIDLAVEITEVMVSSLEGDIAHLPLTELYWNEQSVSIGAAPLHLIYLHYKWPDRYTRLQTAKQISTLLQDNSNPEFRSLYLQYLSKQQYEVDIVDYLSILLLLEDSPFNKEEIIQNIHFPSLISDEFLLKLGYMDKERDDLTPLYSEFSSDLTPNRAKYDRYSNGLALRYIHGIKILEKEYEVPLAKHFLLEWEQILVRHSCDIFDPYDFCSDQFYRQDKIACSCSWVAEASILSAYARTLAYAVDQHSIPVEVALMHAEEVLPFGYVGILSPSNPPVSWPRLDELMKDDPLPGQNELEQYLSQIANADEILLHANGPVIRNHTGVCLDLRVILVFMDDTEIDDPQSIFDSIDHVGNSEEGIFPLAEWAWPSSFGRWEVDWLSRGYFQPTYSLADLPIKSVTQNECSIEYFGGTISNGIWRYWVNQWYPAHRIEVGNSLGTYMTVTKDFFLKLKEHTSSNYYLVAEMTCVDRRKYLRHEGPIKTFAIQTV